MQATQAVFDNRFAMSYGNAYNPSISRSQIANGAVRQASSAFFAPQSFSYAQPRATMSHFEREVSHSPSGTTIKTSMTTVRQPSDPYGRPGQYDHGPANCFNGRDSDRCRIPPPPPRCTEPRQNCAPGADWSNTAVKDNKTSVDLGRYQLDFNKKDSSINMRDTKTGDTTKIWGDPHIDLHSGSANQTSGMFNGPMTFNLPDNTKVTVGTKSSGNAAVSYADQVTITRGNNAYQINGLSEQSKNPLTIDRSRNGRALDAATPDGYSLVANRNGLGWIDPSTGKEPTKADFAKV